MVAYMIQASRARSTTSVMAASAAAFADVCVMTYRLCAEATATPSTSTPSACGPGTAA